MPGKGLSIGLAAAAALILGSVVPALASAAGCPDASTPAAGLDGDRVESSLACEINETRADYGLRPLRSSGPLHRAAASYSAAMIAGGFFSHRGADGSTTISRLRSVGYLRSGWSWMVGENLIWATDDRATPEAIVEAWMESPEHRANLLRPGFRELGVGVRHGTPEDSDDAAGVTVSSEYGARQR